MSLGSTRVEIHTDFPRLGLRAARDERKPRRSKQPQDSGQNPFNLMARLLAAPGSPRKSEHLPLRDELSRFLG